MWQRPSLTSIISLAFIIYVAHSMWTIASLFDAPKCNNEKNNYCLKSFLHRNPTFTLSIFTSINQAQTKNINLIWEKDHIDIKQNIEENIVVKIPSKTRLNGTLFVHVVLKMNYAGLFNEVRKVASLTTFMQPQHSFFNLISTNDSLKRIDPKVIVSHWRSRLTLSIVNEPIDLDGTKITKDMYQHMRFSDNQEYLPILYINEIDNRIKDLMILNESNIFMPLTIVYRPITIGMIRFLTTILDSFQSFENLGFSDKDIDEVKGIFMDTNLSFLILTFTVSSLHLLFDFLAFKNDISYWRKRESMEGISSRAVIWRCGSTAIIFLYLLDENSSMLVLIPMGISFFIELWKVFKAFKIKVNWTSFIPKFSLGSSSQKELQTKAFDKQAMSWLTYLLFPLCIAGSIYSLLYTPHRSWYSWTIQSLVNGVYAFGFIFMLPQLFINYKLKSVAHLPWKAFMYKAFNTFIDDFFVFIISMPTAHRLACFRDDVVFFIYLFQRWQYPVDMKRVNEFGQTFELHDSNVKNEQDEQTEKDDNNKKIK